MKEISEKAEKAKIQNLKLTINEMKNEIDETKESLNELSNRTQNVTISSPITIAKYNLVSKLEYSTNFEVSFEYKASTVPTSGGWHQILVGKVIILMFEASRSFAD